MPIGSSIPTTRSSVWLTRATIAAVRQRAIERGLTLSRQIEELVLDGLKQKAELMVGALIVTGLRQALDIHFHTLRKLMIVSARQAGVAARLNADLTRLLLWDQVQKSPKTVERDVLRDGRVRETAEARRLLDALEKGAQQRSLDSLRGPLGPFLSTLPTTKQSQPDTRRQVVWLTDDGREAIRAFAESQGASFGAGLEVLVRLGLGQPAHEAMSPLLVAHVRQAMDRHFRRFRRVLAAAAREAGIAAGLAEDALYLTLLERAQGEPSNARTARAVLFDEPRTPAGRKAVEIFDRLENGAVRKSVGAMKAKLDLSGLEQGAEVEDVYIEEAH